MSPTGCGGCNSASKRLSDLPGWFDSSSKPMDADRSAAESLGWDVSEPSSVGGDEGHLAPVTLRGSLREAMKAPPTVYQAVGGQRFFDDLVDRFYDAVEGDPLLRPHVSEGYAAIQGVAGRLPGPVLGRATAATARSGVTPVWGCATSPSSSAGPSATRGWRT